MHSEVKVVTDVDLEHTVYSEVYSVCFNVYKSGVIFPLMQNRINIVPFNILALLVWGWIHSV
jgi:hypothetical protein